MKIWEKLFESHGHQILARKGEYEDGKPCVSFHAMTDIGEATFILTYKTEEKRDEFFEQKLGQEFIDKLADEVFAPVLDLENE